MNDLMFTFVSSLVHESNLRLPCPSHLVSIVWIMVLLVALARRPRYDHDFFLPFYIAHVDVLMIFILVFSAGIATTLGGGGVYLFAFVVRMLRFPTPVLSTL